MTGWAPSTTCWEPWIIIDTLKACRSYRRALEATRDGYNYSQRLHGAGYWARNVPKLPTFRSDFENSLCEQMQFEICEEVVARFRVHMNRC